MSNAKRKLFLTLFFNSMIGKGESGSIPGESCGIETPIIRRENVPTDVNLLKRGCIVITNEENYKTHYKNKQPSK
jgi:hypothetical protein